MDQTDVVAVVGTCAPERARCATDLARSTGRVLFPALRVSMAADPVDEALALAPWAAAEGAVVEFPPAIAPTEIIGRFADPGSPARLVGLTCVVDAAHLLDDLGRDDYLVHPLPGGSRRFRARALATATQIEYATTVVCANWDALPTPELSVVLAVVSALGPRARIRLHPAPVDAPELSDPPASAQDRPGWIALLNDEHDPHMTDSRVRTLRYQSLRPFHPERLERLLEDRIGTGEFGAVLRSAGFCRLATRPKVTAHWEQVGDMISLPPVSTDDDLAEDEELLAAGQDIAFIGLDLDDRALVRALDDACLTDDEFAAGPDAWAALADPFPAWAEA
ncbi:GTP-binding protein [Microbacterium sp. gxy059]|uniref:GTP-binding protein n=1 Tax=Microbacterium sp. gxy059 TaxID=2957199 RepID=UPI003D959865